MRYQSLDQVDPLPLELGVIKAASDLDWPFRTSIVLTEADALADLNGTPRPDHPSVDLLTP